MLPSLLAEELQARLTSYLGTTFALADDDARSSLEQLLSAPETSIFKGPYLRTRLPFRRAGPEWRSDLGWVPEGFAPYRHQAQALRRLSSRDHIPEPTIVTTGTGSGKTESFTIPILDHCARQRVAGHSGIKALVLYPMNALANDQAQRIAKLIAQHSNSLGGVTAGLFTGDSGDTRRMSGERVIEDHGILRGQPPDILLTNYKMLDRLLLRQDNTDLWNGAAESLRYVVLDEFHTYDGAQGTDVALLLRRLGMRLGIARSGKPLGDITPVATSATLGDGSRTEELLSFAGTVFGRGFSADSVIREDRLSAEEWLATAGETGDEDDQSTTAAPVGRVPLLAEIEQLFPHSADTDYETLLSGAFTAFFEEGTTPDRHDPVALGAALKRHPLTHPLVEATETPADPHETVNRLAEVAPTWSNATSSGDSGLARTALAAFTALLSLSRSDETTPLLHVETQLWVREVTHLVRSLSNAAAFHWADDQPASAEEIRLAAVFCRHCGRGGWGAKLGVAGERLDDRPVHAWRASAQRSDRFRAFLHAPREAEADRDSVSWLDPGTLEVRGTVKAPEEFVPVLTTPPDDLTTARNGDCPSCGRQDGIRFLGSGVSTLVSVALSHLFGHAEVNDDEKKTLVFTDSVQDAAHRAGFVESRAYAFNVRSALHKVIGSGARLDEIAGRLVNDVSGPEHASSRYALLPPGLVDRRGFSEFWKERSPRKSVKRRVEDRMAFAAHLEFGLNSRTGRTLELTGAISVQVDTESPTWLETRVRRVIDENRPTELDLSSGFGERPLAWVRGILERMRTRGAIYHEFLAKYLTEDNRWHIWGGRRRDLGVPAFPRGRPAPTVPTDAARTENFDTVVAARTWFTWWTKRCLGVPETDAPRLVNALLRMLADEGVLQQRTVKSGASVYWLLPGRILLEPTDPGELASGTAMLRCDVCATRTPVHPDVADQLTHAPCMRGQCLGNLRPYVEPPNYYSELYGTEKVRRVVSQEHTGLLEHEQRARVEKGFKNGTEPDSPNVLVCTPTLELGIDIGELEITALTSLPRTTAGYLQRVGRAGRSSGNAFVVAVLPGRAAELHHFAEPRGMLAGDVVPPACYLDAEEILHRQYLASLIDRSAARLGSKWRRPPNAKELFEKGLDNSGWLRRLLDDARKHSVTYVTEFLDALDEHVTAETAAALRVFAGADQEDDAQVPPIERTVQEAVHRWNRERDELNERISELDRVEKELNQNERLLDEAGESDRRRVVGEKKAVQKMRFDLDTDDWLSAMEGRGLLPNYTLLDDTTRLDVSLWWVDEETQQPEIEKTRHERGSRSALSELAPGTTFYSNRRAVCVDAVDVGSARSPNLREWRCCPSCGWSGEDGTGAVRACPRCGDVRAADSGQRLRVVPFRQVSAFAPLDESRFGDEDEQRRRVTFEIAVSADVDPADIREPWQFQGYPFGAEFCHTIRIRWFNLGPADRGGSERRIAGQDHPAPLFHACEHCGVVPAAYGREPHDARHRGWCPQRQHPDPRAWVDIALMHELRTEALRLLVPPTLMVDDSQLVSFTAAVKLGLRAVLGGTPDHLDAFSSVESGPNGRRQLVVLHDLVPGGTGYLRRFAEPEQILNLLQHAKKALEQCPCAERNTAACHRCLIPLVRPDEVDLLSRQRALVVVDDILGRWDPVAGTEGLREIDVTPDETHIERRFRDQLTRWARGAGTEPKVSASNRGDRVRFTSGRDRQRTWLAEPQVLIGNTVRPDFVISPVDFVGPRIAVFCDSVRFHADPEHNLTAKDARQRARLRAEGYLVWAVTHEDMQTFEQVLHGAEPQPLNFLSTGQRSRFVKGAHKASGLGSTAVGKVRGDAISLLTNLLGNPDRGHWRNVARAVTAGMFADRGREGVHRLAAEELSEAVAVHGRGEPLTTDGDRMVSAAWTNAGAPVLLLPDAKTRYVGAVLVLDDAELRVGGPEHLAHWRDWLAASNLLQLLDDEHDRFAAVTTSMSVDSDELPEFITGTRRLSRPWQDVLDVADSKCEGLLRELADRDLPPPEPGEEGPDGAWQIDLAWPDLSVAVLFEARPERVQQLRSEGWQVAEPDTNEIAQLLEPLEPNRETEGAR